MSMRSSSPGIYTPGSCSLVLAYVTGHTAQVSRGRHKHIKLTQALAMNVSRGGGNNLHILSVSTLRSQL